MKLPRGSRASPDCTASEWGPRRGEAPREGDRTHRTPTAHPAGLGEAESLRTEPTRRDEARAGLRLRHTCLQLRGLPRTPQRNYYLAKNNAVVGTGLSHSDMDLSLQLQRWTDEDRNTGQSAHARCCRGAQKLRRPRGPGSWFPRPSSSGGTGAPGSTGSSSARKRPEGPGRSPHPEPPPGKGANT